MMDSKLYEIEPESRFGMTSEADLLLDQAKEIRTNRHNIYEVPKPQG